MKQTLIQNVQVWTMDEQDTRFTGWALLADGRIADMGEGEPPACADVLDGEGGVLTPGLIDIHSHLGLYEDGLGFEGADGNEDTDPVTPHLRAIDGINPMDRGFREAREAGVTAVAVSPGSANPIGGQIALIKTAGRRVDDMVLKAPLAIKFALTYPEYVDKLILNGANVEMFNGIKPHFQLPIYAAYGLLAAAAHVSRRAARRRDVFGLMVRRYGVSLDDLKRLTMPTLIIVGERDMVRDSQTKEMAARIPHCRVEVFRDGDHFVAAKQPSRFNRTVIEFLLGR